MSVIRQGRFVFILQQQQQQMSVIKVKVKLSHYKPEQALGLSGRLRLRIFHDVRHMKVVGSSALRTDRFYSQEYPGTHF
jgi:hypothetical protein